MTDPATVVRSFFEVVRSGRAPDRAPEFMADVVIAHQIASENPTTVRRSPLDYAAHVRDMQASFGNFDLRIQELLADGDRVYVRWRQDGRHVGEHDGHAPTGRPVIGLGSAVYRVVNGRIVEYWIQVDRLGVALQLRRDASGRAEEA